MTVFLAVFFLGLFVHLSVLIFIGLMPNENLFSERVCVQNVKYSVKYLKLLRLYISICPPDSPDPFAHVVKRPCVVPSR